MYVKVAADPIPALHSQSALMQSLLPWFPIALLVGAAIVLRHFTAGNTDVSWLLIAGERMLDGQRLYADILETNPPVAVLAYIPGIVIGRVLGLSAESVVDGLLLLSAVVSLALVAAILKSSSVGEGTRQKPLLLLYLALAVLTILPTQAFGQREHIAVIELLPPLAVLVVRANSLRPQAWAIAIAGIGLGLVLAFKPYFAIAAVLCIGAVAIQAKSYRILVAPEHFIAAALVAIYGLCTLLFFPAYFTVIGPIARDVYIPIGLPFGLMLEKPVVMLWVGALIATGLLWRRSTDPALLALTAMSIGFGVVFFLQRKGWPYHSFPMMAFVLLALGRAIELAWDRATVGRGWVAAAGILLTAFFAQSMVWFNHAFDARPIAAAVASLGPHPVILTISAQAGIGHPMTRELGGTWASRQQGLLIAGYYKYLLDYEKPDAQTIARIDGYALREREALVEDFRKYQPTVVLVDRLTDNWDAWLRQTPALVELMKGYRLSQTVMDVDIYSKRAD